MRATGAAADSPRPRTAPPDTGRGRRRDEATRGRHGLDAAPRAWLVSERVDPRPGGRDALPVPLLARGFVRAVLLLALVRFDLADPAGAARG
jgi:hypothetical protein